MADLESLVQAQIDLMAENPEDDIQLMQEGEDTTKRFSPSDRAKAIWMLSRTLREQQQASRTFTSLRPD